MLLAAVEFGSLLSYSPRGTSDQEKKSKTMMEFLKGDQIRGNPPVSASDFISNLVKKKGAGLSFGHFFNGDPVLVPVPKSSLMQSGTLWVPLRLAKSLVQNGLGKEVNPCLIRVEPLPKSATSSSPDRPKAIQHYNSLKVQKTLTEPKEILLIDDVVTRGATILGSASRLGDVYPTARIRAFAAMRTMSPPDVFKKILDPCTGTITLSGQDSFRRP